MARPWWVTALQASVWVVLMSLVMSWMARGRFRPRPESQTGTLAHPFSTLVMGVVGVAFFGGIAVISNTIGRNRTTTIWTTLGFVAFALASMTMITDYFFARHRVSESGMEHGGMLRRRGTFHWTDVERVRYGANMKWFVIELRSGSKIRLSAMLMGLPQFARLALAHVPSAAMDDQTHAVLRETERGQPPRLW
jgi:hypothetical protein